jgi:DNA-binding MarR family transcriptional regulator
MTEAIDHIDKAQPKVSKENGYLALLRVTGLLDRVMQPYFSRFGVSRSQWACLRILHHAELKGTPGLRPVDLGRRLLVRPPSITGLISRLMRSNYVVSRSSAQDGRGKLIYLTVRGRRLVEKILAGHAEQIAIVMSGLDTEGQRQLSLLLKRLAAHLESMAEQKDCEPDLRKNSDVRRKQDPYLGSDPT